MSRYNNRYQRSHSRDQYDDDYYHNRSYRNREDANSETIREKVEQRFRGDIMSRRQKKSMVIIMHSRWHKNDLIGTIKQDEYLKNVI